MRERMAGTAFPQLKETDASICLPYTRQLPVVKTVRDFQNHGLFFYAVKSDNDYNKDTRKIKVAAGSIIQDMPGFVFEPTYPVQTET